VARLAYVLAEESPRPEGRVDRLERRGILQRAKKAKSGKLFGRPRPAVRAGSGVLEALLEERRSGR
jgi:hypothetical protein